MISKPRIALGALLVSATCACNGPRFEMVTVPPPTKTASLDQDAETIRLSKGTAVGIECNAFNGKPCEGASVKVDGAELVDTYRAYTDVVASTNYRGADTQGGNDNRVVFVLVGRKQGNSRITFSTSDGDQSFDVEVTR